MPDHPVEDDRLPVAEVRVVVEEAKRRARLICPRSLRLVCGERLQELELARFVELDPRQARGRRAEELVLASP